MTGQNTSAWVVFIGFIQLICRLLVHAVVRFRPEAVHRILETLYYSTVLIAISDVRI